MFSMFVFMCRDPRDAISKVSCCVETYRDFDVIVEVPVARENENTVNLRSASFVVIMLL